MELVMPRIPLARAAANSRPDFVKGHKALGLGRDEGTVGGLARVSVTGMDKPVALACWEAVLLPGPLGGSCLAFGDLFARAFQMTLFSVN